MTRPPLDSETVLGQDPNRFTLEGRFERKCRRKVYCENSTGRLFYVDNLHFGQAAHIEVFDSNEYHLGIADLHGNINASTMVPGRRIKW